MSVEPRKEIGKLHENWLEQRVFSIESCQTDHRSSERRVAGLERGTIWNTRLGRVQLAGARNVLTWQCWKSAPLVREAAGRDFAHVVVKTFLRNWVKCPYWHSFSAWVQSLLDPILAIAGTIVSELADARVVRSELTTRSDPPNALRMTAPPTPPAGTIFNSTSISPLLLVGIPRARSRDFLNEPLSIYMKLADRNEKMIKYDYFSTFLSVFRL